MSRRVIPILLISGSLLSCLYIIGSRIRRPVSSIVERCAVRIAENARPVKAYFQDVNRDGTNDIVCLDKNNHRTTLFAYGDSSYCTKEEIREIKSRELESEMSNYSGLSVTNKNPGRND